MRLLTLELQNFCQYRRRTVNFHPGLLAICGPNGSGKSNLLNGVQFALTGVTPQAGVRAANICQLATADDPSAVTLTFEHLGTRAVVRRDLRKASATLTLDNGSPIRGARRVDATILELLGTDKRIIDDIVLVGQGAIFGFLAQETAARADAFAKLFGTTAAEPAFRAANKTLAAAYMPSRRREELQLREELEAAETERGRLGDDVDGSAEAYWQAELNRAHAAWTAWQAVQRTEQLSAAYAAANVPQPPPPQPSADAARLHEQLSALEGEWRAAATLAAVPPGVCMTCGQSTTALMPAVTEAAGRAAQLSQQLIEQRRKCQHAAAEAQAVTAWQAAEAERQRRLADLQAALAAVAPVPPELSLLDADNLGRQAAAKLQELRQTREARAALDGKICGLRAALQELVAYAAAAAQKEEKLARLARVAAALQRDAAPRSVVERRLEELASFVNQNLELLGADYRVRASSDMSYVAHFADGRAQPAQRLSSGQQVVLALAFRLAVNFSASDLNFLALDEPTAYLDQRHIAGFAPTLARLRQLAGSRGLQCVIITHEQGLEPLFDAVIPAGEPAG